MTKPTENEFFEQWAIDYGLDWEPNFTRLDVESAWQARAELADKEKAELQAQINELREALICIDEDLVNPVYYRLVKEALDKTAPQCLQAHDDEVIERCAKVCDESYAFDSDGFAKEIRALKGKQND